MDGLFYSTTSHRHIISHYSHPELASRTVDELPSNRATTRRINIIWPARKGEMIVDNADIVRAYYAALDSADIQQVSKYLSEQYQLVDFASSPMDQKEMLELISLLKAAMPNLKHSLSNLHSEGNTVKLTVQLSGTNSEPLDLRKLGIGIVPRTRRFIIFPNGTFEFTFRDGKITVVKDISPVSPNRRMPGMLKALGINAPSARFE